MCVPSESARNKVTRICKTSKINPIWTIDAIGSDLQNKWRGMKSWIQSWNKVNNAKLMMFIVTQTKVDVLAASTPLSSLCTSKHVILSHTE